MARTKTKPNPYQAFEDALRKKQHELLDSYERDKAAGNAQPDDGIQDLADKAASAFVRIREGNFGKCTNCGNVIGEKRLQAIPWTAFCIDCQELVEKGLLT